MTTSLASLAVQHDRIKRQFSDVKIELEEEKLSGGQVLESSYSHSGANMSCLLNTCMEI